jgi:DNA-binding NarL/FixJ family response regulator
VSGYDKTSQKSPGTWMMGQKVLPAVLRFTAGLGLRSLPRAEPVFVPYRFVGRLFRSASSLPWKTALAQLGSRREPPGDGKYVAGKRSDGSNMTPMNGQDLRSPSGPARVLIVDDHELIRFGLARMIREAPNLEVCGEAGSEADALAKIRELRPDLAVVDIALNTGDGLDLVRRIKASDSTVRLIVYSMHPDRIYAERALRAGASGYVSKQNPAQTLLEAIRRVRDGKMYFSEEITERLLQQAKNSGAAPRTPEDLLSDRELEVLRLIGQGLTPRQIADQMHLSPRTIDTYRERLKVKLRLESAAQLHHYAVHWLLQH